MALDFALFNGCSNDFCNTRFKFYPNPDGSYFLSQIMICDKNIFNPLKLEKRVENSQLTREQRERLNVESEIELASAAFGDMWEEEEKEKPHKSTKRAQNRAISRIYDIINCTLDLSYFCTITLDSAYIDRYDYSVAVKKLGKWLANRVQRFGLKYIFVPELHKDGAIHFHGLVNDVVKLVDSGTVLRPCKGKPVKLQTALKQGFKLDELKTVYNIPDWDCGFTTATPVSGERAALARYVTKYITKAADKVGGRWYLSGGVLGEPVFKYDFTSFEDYPDDHLFIPDGTSLKFKTVYP